MAAGKLPHLSFSGALPCAQCFLQLPLQPPSLRLLHRDLVFAFLHLFGQLQQLLLGTANLPQFAAGFAAAGLPSQVAQLGDHAVKEGTLLRDTSLRALLDVFLGGDLAEVGAELQLLVEVFLHQTIINITKLVYLDSPLNVIAN